MSTSLHEAVVESIIVQFCNAHGDAVGGEFSLPITATRQQLCAIVQQLFPGGEVNDGTSLYSFSVAAGKGGDVNVRVENDLGSTIASLPDFSAEETLRVHFYPLETFRVMPVTRCTASLAGHTGPVTCAAFNTRSDALATGGGDLSVRIWDLSTETPVAVLKGHNNHVRELAWSCFGNLLASAGAGSGVYVWNIFGDELLGPPNLTAPTHQLNRHKKAITALAWQPLHVMAESQNVPLLVSASLDGSIIVWDIPQRVPHRVLSGHRLMVTCLRFSGRLDAPVLISASRDAAIKLWQWQTGEQLSQMDKHASWVNNIALNTDFVLSSGGFGPKQKTGDDRNDCATLAEARAASSARFTSFFQRNCGGRELAVSCSDDCTLFLWDTRNPDKMLSRLTGHQGVVSDCQFSPDARWIASCSFDRSVRIWDGGNGKFVATLRGHVGPVYRLVWSPDSRYVASASKDSTVKVWHVAQKKLAQDLSGHGDEVYAVDWSRDGQRVASGSKDAYVKIWRF